MFVPTCKAERKSRYMKWFDLDSLGHMENVDGQKPGKANQYGGQTVQCKIPPPDTFIKILDLAEYETREEDNAGQQCKLDGQYDS